MPGISNVGRFFKLSWHRAFWRSIREDALFQRLLKNSSYLFSANVITSGLGFVQSIIVARALGVSHYGVLALVTTYVATIRQLVDFRVWETVIKYVSEFWVQGDTARAMATVKLAYWIDFLTGVLAFGIAVLGAPLAAKFLHQPLLTELAWIVALSSLFATINGTSSAILRVFDRFKWISIGEVVGGGVSLGLVGLMVLLGYGLRGIVMASVMTALVVTAVFSFFSLKVIRSNMWHVRREGKISLLRARFREMAWFLFHTNLSAFWGMIIRRFDILILGHFRSSTEVGYFKLAKNFVSLIAKIHDPLYNSIFPEISKLWALGDVKKFNRFLKKLTLITSSIFIPLALGMFLLSGLVIRWTVGTQFAPAALAIRIMIWGITIGCVFTWARPTVIAIGMPVLGNIAGAVGAITVLILAFALVPSYGYVASSSLAVLNYIVGNLILIGGYTHHLHRNKHADKSNGDS